MCEKQQSPVGEYFCVETLALLQAAEQQHDELPSAWSVGTPPSASPTLAAPSAVDPATRPAQAQAVQQQPPLPAQAQAQPAATAVEEPEEAELEMLLQFATFSDGPS